MIDQPWTLAKPYFFCQPTVFSSHNNHDFSQTREQKMIRQIRNERHASQ